MIEPAKMKAGTAINGNISEILYKSKGIMERGISDIVRAITVAVPKEAKTGTPNSNRPNSISQTITSIGIPRHLSFFYNKRLIILQGQVVRLNHSYYLQQERDRYDNEYPLQTET